MRPVWESTGGVDGWVSLEVDPTLAYDREATFAQAIRFHTEVDRQNLYVKIPATEPCLGAIEDCIAKGRSINVTLIFSLERYAAVVEAYLRGLERLVASGGDASKVLRSRASSSPGSTPKATSGSPSWVGTTSRAGWQSPTPGSRTRTGSRRSPASGGPISQARARVRSDASGPRPRPRTPRTAMSSTSRS